MGLNAKTEAQVTSKKNTITPRLFFVRNDSDRRIMLIDLIRSSASDKGNTIIYVNDEQRRNHLVEFLLDYNLGEFSERILLTNQHASTCRTCYAQCVYSFVILMTGAEQD
jgi:superfamily II DNA/RNA helicase